MCSNVKKEKGGKKGLKIFINMLKLSPYQEGSAYNNYDRKFTTKKENKYLWFIKRFTRLFYVACLN